MEEPKSEAVAHRGLGVTHVTVVAIWKGRSQIRLVYKILRESARLVNKEKRLGHQDKKVKEISRKLYFPSFKMMLNCYNEV